MRQAWIALAVTALLGAAPAAAQEPPNTKKSDRVTYLRSLDEPQTISARFRGGLMYLSTMRGLSIYDVSKPAEPTRLSFLALPNFENEDIDVGNGIALISNDPSEGQGLLHVIDVRDPAAPKRITSFNTGTAAFSLDAGILSNQIGPAFGIGTGTGHTASCLQDCRFVWLAGTPAGIDIVDLRDPANPKYATPANFPADEATAGIASHDVQFDQGGRAWVAGAGGTAQYDVTNPVKPVLTARTDEKGMSRYLETAGTDDGSTYNDFIHHNSMRIRNSSLASLPAGADPAADSNVVAVTEEDYNRPTCKGAGSFETWALAPGEVRGGGADGKGPPVPVLRPLDKWDVEVDPSRATLCSAHYFDDRAGLIAQGWYEQGVRFLDISNPRDIRQVGYYIPQKNLTWGALYPPTDPTGEIVYALDNLRGIDVIRFDRPDPPATKPGEKGPDAGSLSQLPTVTAPPADGPGVGKDEVPGRARSGRRPDVAVSLTDGRRVTRAGLRHRYRLTVRHVGGAVADDVVARVDLPRVVRGVRAPGASLRGRRLTYRIGDLAVGASRTFTLGVSVRRTPRARAVLLRAALLARDDVNPRDNVASDRDPLRRRGRARPRAASIASLAGLERASGVTQAERDRAAADHRLAQRNRGLATTGQGAIAVETKRVVRSAFGYACRL